MQSTPQSVDRSIGDVEMPEDRAAARNCPDCEDKMIAPDAEPIDHRSPNLAEINGRREPPPKDYVLSNGQWVLRPNNQSLKQRPPGAGGASDYEGD